MSGNRCEKHEHCPQTPHQKHGATSSRLLLALCRATQLSSGPHLASTMRSSTPVACRVSTLLGVHPEEWRGMHNRHSKRSTQICMEMYHFCSNGPPLFSCLIKATKNRLMLVVSVSGARRTSLIFGTFVNLTRTSKHDARYSLVKCESDMIALSALTIPFAPTASTCVAHHSVKRVPARLRSTAAMTEVNATEPVATKAISRLNRSILVIVQRAR
ncbi:hypothetical protein PENSPDRAFT_153296 [Peniophora sp. CONT]|nr:hypothetical protein PENSPDRAFT_153296 [Peniophora sp. CONT]